MVLRFTLHVLLRYFFKKSMDFKVIVLSGINGVVEIWSIRVGLNLSLISIPCLVIHLSC